MRVTGLEEIGSLKVLGVDIIGEIYFFYGERKSLGSARKDVFCQFFQPPAIQSIPARCLGQGLLGQGAIKKELSE